MKQNNIHRLAGCAFLLVVSIIIFSLYPFTNTDNNNPTKVLGIVVTATEDSWKDGLNLSIEIAARKKGMKIMPIEAERSQASQIEAIRALIVYRADAIVFSPVIETGWDNVLLEAKNAGIPIVTVEKSIRQNSDEIGIGYVGYDYYANAKKAAQYLLDITKKKNGDFVELYGTVGSYPAKEIARGFRQTFASDGRYQIDYSVCGDFMRSRGREITEGLLKNGQGIDTIISHNDAMTLGAIDALESVNKIPGTDVKIISFGGGRDTVELYRQGKINCLIDCDLTTIGDRTLQVVDILMQNETAKNVIMLANSYMYAKGASSK